MGIDPIKRIRRMPGWGEHFFSKLLTNITKQKGQILLAWDKDQPVGFIAGAVKEQTKENLLEVYPTKLGIIFDFFVKEEYRKQGVGALLINKLEAYLKSQDCDSLWISLMSFNQNAHNYYKKYGFVDREIGMLKRI